MVGGLVVAGVNAGAVSAAPPANTDNVKICHRTHSVTNPYVLITVDQRSVGNANSKHGGGAHDLWATTVYGSATANKPNPNVFDPSKTYPANDKKWGDIIAFTDVSGNPLTGSAANVAGLNNTGIGAQIFNGTGAYAGLCRAMNARDFYEVEKSAGVPTNEILDDLNELDSPEFASALTACGGTFTGCNPSNLGTTSISIPTTTTTPAGTTGTSGSTATNAPGTGGLQVRTWIDRDRNSRRTSTDRTLAGMQVTITGPGGTTQTAKTDSKGLALFTNLTPGSWKVVSVLSKAGYEKVYDSDGSVNWKSTLTVTEGKIAKASYAAATAVATLPRTGVAGSGLLAAWALALIAGGWVLLGSRRRTS